MAWLIRGSRGDQVTDLQGLLWQAGFYDGKIDGRLGYKTEAAIKDMQREIGAKVDGFWGTQSNELTARWLARFNDGGALDAGKPPVIPARRL